MDATEEKVYERRKFELESEIEECKEALEKLQQEGLLKTFDYEEFSNFLRNAHQKWEDASPQQKHALARFLFSNIKIGDGKVLELAYNPIIRDMFVSDGGAPSKKSEPISARIGAATENSGAAAALRPNLLAVAGRFPTVRLRHVVLTCTIWNQSMSPENYESYR